MYTFPRLTVEQEDELLKKLNYSRQQLEKDKVLLRTWLNEQEHLPECRKRESDSFLTSYMVGCKGSLEKAKKKLDAYYSIRGHGEIFTERDTLDYAKSADTFQFFAAMPKPTPDGNLVTMIALLEKDPEKCIMANAFKRAILYDECRLREGSGISRGDIYVVDAKDFTGSHLIKLSPSHIKSIIAWIQSVRPFRLSKFLIFNTEPLFETFANTVIRPLLSDKLKKRFIVTRDGDISKHFEHMDILPSTFGGKEMDKSAMSREFSRALYDGVKDILPTLRETTDESKRPKLNGYVDNPHFGAFGSIKTLVTD